MVSAYFAAALRLLCSLHPSCLEETARTDRWVRWQGFSVRQQKKSTNAEVRRAIGSPLASVLLNTPGDSVTLHGTQVASLAARVISKWKEAVLAEQPSRKANKHRVTQNG